MKLNAKNAHCTLVRSLSRACTTHTITEESLNWVKSFVCHLNIVMNSSNQMSSPIVTACFCSKFFFSFVYVECMACHSIECEFYQNEKKKYTKREKTKSKNLYVIDSCAQLCNARFTVDDNIQLYSSLRLL